MSDTKIEYNELVRKISKKLLEVGISKEQANIIADILAHGDARGVRSHGTIRLEHYLNRIKQGGINLKSEFKFKLMAKSCGVVDVSGGMGHIGMYNAAKEAINHVKETGIFAVSIQNASHCGALSYYINMGIEAGLIGMACVNTNKCVVLFGGEKPFFGTNPIAYGFPGNKHRILIDMATSEVAFGKILLARENGSTIPNTWGVDEKGLQTTDPSKVVAATPMAGYKGTAIATMVEGFTGFFTGFFGSHLVPMYEDLDKFRNTGGFLLFMDPAAFGSAEVYKNSTDRIFEEIKNSTPAQGCKPLVVAGELEDTYYKDSLKNGVLIYKSVFKLIES